jgi:hypothetical protein
MTSTQMQWMAALTKDRLDSANTLKKPSMRGIQRSVIDKYSDQAHFIYELLQNADDVYATNARFTLREDGLVFIHNGKTLFTISDPATEEADTNNGTLGHVNSITSIANSTKSQVCIGKFGVGFKAVFQYTQTPHIYDPDIRFKIERFIVPEELNNDFEGRKDGETVFWFPFNHETLSPKKCYSEIYEKLKSLVFPVLFLTNLEFVSFDAGNHVGQYSKQILQSKREYSLTAKLISIASETDGKRTTEQLWLFSRDCEARQHSYSVGFFLHDEHITSVSYPAFCFFPTKESTNLNFIVHAPFLLTDSREGIKAGEDWNRTLIQELASLAADSLLSLRDRNLIDDNIIHIIPYDEAVFNDLNYRNTVSFKPFYAAIKQKLQTEDLLPAANSQYSGRDRSYWASDTDLSDLFSDTQLALLTGTSNAHWVFPSLGKKDVLNSKNKALSDYIDGGDARAKKTPNLIVSDLDPEAMLKKITNAFIERQSMEWMHRFYEYLARRTSYILTVRRKPIFLNQENKAVSAFDDNDQLVLFLPDDDISGYPTVKNELLSNRTTRDFIEKLGIKKPSLRDEIYNMILPAYASNDGIDTTPHFNKFFNYFKECKNEGVAEFIGLIKDKSFVRCKAAANNKVFRAIARDIYMPTPDLTAWFETKPETMFLCLDDYQTCVNYKDHEPLIRFLVQLGVRMQPALKTRQIDESEVKSRDIKGNYSTKPDDWIEPYIDGCEQLIAEISKDRSRLLWRQLLALRIWSNGRLKGNHKYYYRKQQEEPFESSEAKRLRESKWILDREGVLRSAAEVTVQTLSTEYDTPNAESLALIAYLNIRDGSKDTANLSKDQCRLLERGKLLEGLSDDECIQMIAKIRRSNQLPSSSGSIAGSTNGSTKTESDMGAVSANDGWEPSVEKVLHELGAKVKARRTKHNNPVDTGNVVDNDEIDDFSSTDDEDDFTKPSVNFRRMIEQEKIRSTARVDEIGRNEELTEELAACAKYSFRWFMILLELECFAGTENNNSSKHISIGFAKVEKDPGTERTLILKHPDRYIPQSLEDLSDIPLVFDVGGFKKIVAVEVVSVKSYTLRAKLKTNAEIDNIDLSKVQEARIDAKNPVFLLEELRKQFERLGEEKMLGDDYDMKQNLPVNIEFVFGPPGTGKTTHLANNVLIPFMRQPEQLKVLVLTPTNKAADVLVTRIMEVMGADRSYEEWLVRFGTVNDPKIEGSPVARDKTFDIRTLPRNVTVTTIARFPYDYFLPDNETRLHLAALKWDFIVIDEASMIPLANIVYPLYKKKPQMFIIAGDPFQIEPIVAVEEWKDENIYTLVDLKSFANPNTVPCDYTVTNLSTQYRSIPVIGEVFSKFTYDGILKHHRISTNQRPLNIDGMEIGPLNIVKFPVSKYESVYRPKRLQGKSSYHVYSALFTFEFVKFLAKQLQRNHADEPVYKIGIIAPYRAQATLIDKLYASWHSQSKCVDFQVGTIHGFQGDECDIIIAVFNPPPSISSSDRMFLNKQNILNVSISRARDYLFIVMPDDDTENVSELRKIKMIEFLIKNSGAYTETHANEIESLIFGNEHYLENNAFSTSHQLVNIYGRPEKRYEVRSEDMAVDVQIHETGIHSETDSDRYSSQSV